MKKVNGKPGFTLIELLVVIAIIGLLIGILMPAMSRARTQARIVKAHAELRGITIALQMYRHENNRQLPPTRFSCSSRTAYDLPVELLTYLPRARKNQMDIVRMSDPFTPEDNYKYRAVGTGILNETTILDNAATLWVPDNFPSTVYETGKYYNDPSISPVRYAIWSMGPDPASPKFDIPGRLPLPSRYWLKNAADTGVIVHYEDSDGRLYMSP